MIISPFLSLIYRRWLHRSFTSCHVRSTSSSYYLVTILFYTEMRIAQVFRLRYLAFHSFPALSFTKSEINLTYHVETSATLEASNLCVVFDVVISLWAWLLFMNSRRLQVFLIEITPRQYGHHKIGERCYIIFISKRFHYQMGNAAAWDTYCFGLLAFAFRHAQAKLIT